MTASNRSPAKKKKKRVEKEKPKVTNCALTIDQMVVIAALLNNSLQVQSVLIDREQTVEILLVGSLRKKDNCQ